MPAEYVGRPVKRLEETKLVTAAAHASAHRRPAPPAGRRPCAGRVVGIGLASYVEICGMEDDETSDVEVGEDGRVTVLTGTASHGQGHETSYALLVAEGPARRRRPRVSG